MQVISDSPISLHFVNTSDAVATELTRMILDGSVAPGARLSEIEISTRFGVSRQSTRSAFSELTFVGLLTREPNRGVRVAKLTRSDLCDLYFVREIVETATVCYLVAHPELMPSVDDAMRGFRLLAEDASWSDVVESDLAFHHTLVTSVGSRRLARIHDLLAVETRLATVGAKEFIGPGEMVAEHQALLDAISASDPEAAVARYRQHLAWGTDQVLNALPDESARVSTFGRWSPQQIAHRLKLDHPETGDGGVARNDSPVAVRPSPGRPAQGADRKGTDLSVHDQRALDGVARQLKVGLDKPSAG